VTPWKLWVVLVNATLAWTCAGPLAGALVAVYLAATFGRDD